VWATVNEDDVDPGQPVHQPIAFVAQDGQERLPVPWEHFEALFVGGSTQWKLGPHAAALIREAKRHDKWVHVGRVNTLRRIEWFKALEVDSIDGSGFARFTRVRLPMGTAALRAPPRRGRCCSGRRPDMPALQLPLLDAGEVAAASSACQRWSHGTHSWRRRRDGARPPRGRRPGVTTGTAREADEHEPRPAPVSGVVLCHRQGKQMVQPQLLEVGLDEELLPPRFEQARPLGDLAVAVQAVGPRTGLDLRMLVILDLERHHAFHAAGQVEQEGGIKRRPVAEVARGPGAPATTRNAASRPCRVRGGTSRSPQR